MVESDLVVNSGAVLLNSGTLQLNGAATFGANENLAFTAQNTEFIVNGSTSTSQPIFNFDGTNTTTINSGASLTVNSTNIDNAGPLDQFDTTINMAGGNLRVTLADGAWVMEGTLNMNNPGGALTSSNLSSVISSDDITFDATGTNTIGGTLAAVDAIVVEAGAMFNGAGALVNAATSTMNIENGTTIGVDLINEGRLLPGLSPGGVSLDQFEQTNAGVLEIEIDGSSLNQFDRLIITNLAQLDGTLELQPSIVPDYGDSFVIMLFAGSAGNFSSVTGAYVNDALTLAPILSRPH